MGAAKGCLITVIVLVVMFALIGSGQEGLALGLFLVGAAIAGTVSGLKKRQAREADVAGAASGVQAPPTAAQAQKRISGAAQSAAVAAQGGMGRDGEWHPPVPAGDVIEAWIPGWRNLEVAGEYYRQAEFTALFRNIKGFRSDRGAEITDLAILGDDRHNPYGEGQAVSVWVRGHHVGYVPNSATDVWHPVVAALKDRGQVLGVPATVWAVKRPREEVQGRVSLTVPDPAHIFRANGLPDRGVLLPVGNRIQVTKEDDHIDVLRAWVNGDPAGVPVAVTLHAITEIRPRSAPELVEVRIDGERVGVLSNQTSGHLLPLVKYIEARGHVPTARGIVKGSTLKAEVEITTIKAQDADELWLKSLGDPVPVTVHNTRPEVEWDDGSSSELGSR